MKKFSEKGLSDGGFPVVGPHRLRLLEEKHSTDVLLFLRRHDGPAITKTIMMAIEVRNWATVANTLRKLEEAGLVIRVDTRIGKYASKAKMWRLEPKVGVRVAEALEDIDRWMTGATSQA